MENKFEEILKDASLRITQPRKAIFKTLVLSSRPLSHVEIGKANPTIDKASVYRTIELFMNIGVVTAISHGWKQRYELAAPFRPHHHHLHCLKCGSIEEIQSEELEQIIDRLAHNSHFQVVGHDFELTGFCENCR